MAQTFKKAFENLKKREAPIAKGLITKLCKWNSPALFYMKMNGERPIMDRSEKNIDEVSVIETTFKGLGLHAWTGEPINL